MNDTADRARIDNEPFSIPFIAPPYGPPPYPVESAKLVIVRYEADKDAVARAVPRPLEPLDDGVVTAFIGDMWQSRGPGAYLEGGLVVGCRYKDHQSTFVPILLTSTDEAVFVGREVFGLPKYLCDPGTVNVDGNGRSASLLRRGTEILSLGVLLDEREDGIDRLPKHRYFLKRVPSPDPDFPSKTQLIYQELTEHSVNGSWRGRGFVRVGRSTQIDLTPFACRRVLEAWYIEAKWNVPAAKVLLDEDT